MADSIPGEEHLLLLIEARFDVVGDGPHFVRGNDAVDGSHGKIQRVLLSKAKKTAPKIAPYMAEIFGADE